jgi:hypothetical protein
MDAESPRRPATEAGEPTKWLERARAETDPRDVSVCIICGGTAVARKCKIICQNCGYTRDCSDP